MYKNVYVNEWVEQMAKMTQPDSIVWIDGSEEERERLTKQAVSTGEMIELNSEKLPGVYLIEQRKTMLQEWNILHLFVPPGRKMRDRRTTGWRRARRTRSSEPSLQAA